MLRYGKVGLTRTHIYVCCRRQAYVNTLASASRKLPKYRSSPSYALPCLLKVTRARVLPFTSSVGDVVRRWWDEPETNGVHPRPRHHNLVPRRRGILELFVRPRRAADGTYADAFANTTDVTRDIRHIRRGDPTTVRHAREKSHREIREKRAGQDRPARDDSPTGGSRDTFKMLPPVVTWH